ncbi:TPA: hypothetical protein DF272_00460 [Candidatus Falkowbacteria bacterium]|nr:hypothetical protein [Candidatus Falkowbacteria bacterium]
MKIINPPRQSVFTLCVVCPHCQARLEINQSDVFRSENYNNCYNYHYLCPCCRKHNHLDKDIIDSRLTPFERDRVPKKPPVYDLNELTMNHPDKNSINWL